MSAHNPDDLRRIYSARFDASRQYRDLVWQVLIDDFFRQFIQPDDRCSTWVADTVNSAARSGAAPSGAWI
jgi:hypothetical protein